MEENKTPRNARNDMAIMSGNRRNVIRWGSVNVAYVRKTRLEQYSVQAETIIERNPFLTMAQYNEEQVALRELERMFEAVKSGDRAFEFLLSDRKPEDRNDRNAEGEAPQ